MFCLFTAVMLVIGGILTVKHKFLPSFDVLWNTGTVLYIAPWMRIPPYCVGVACGWYLNSYRKSFNVSDVSFKILTMHKRSSFTSLLLLFVQLATAQLYFLHIIVHAGAGASQYDST